MEVKKGKQYGDWTVTQYKPLTYDDSGANFGGDMKLVNQETYDEFLIQYDVSKSKYWTSVKNKQVSDKSPEKVIQKATKLLENKMGVIKLKDLVNEAKYWLSAVGKTDDFGDAIRGEFIDGATKQGPWALMTPKSWKTHGKGKLGTGYGQRYEYQTNGKWLKVEG